MKPEGDWKCDARERLPQFESRSALTLERAIALAATKHAGQLDKGGQPYILHPLRVMMALGEVPDWVRIAAVLHDAIEDTDLTLEGLRQEGASDRVVELLSLLTRPPHRSYQEYIEAIGEDEEAELIKIADLEDNMRLDRQPFGADDPHTLLRRLWKYGVAHAYLSDKIPFDEFWNLMGRLP